MTKPKAVILVTDGDEYANRAIESVASSVGGRCISMSHGNPSVLTGTQLIELIQMAPSEPVFVLFDDSGYVGEGAGENALKFVATHPSVRVLGVIAVASKTKQAEWAKVDVCIDRDGQLTSFGVDKFGIPEFETGRINGDTVYCLDEIDVPIIVGIGDIGKMAGRDSYKKGAPITQKAVQIILERSGFNVQ